MPGKRKIQGRVFPNVILALISILFCLGLFEVGARVLEHLRGEVPKSDDPNSYAVEARVYLNPIKDAQLGLRLEPNTHGHDALGYRNPSVPTQCDIVNVGSSMTWGVLASQSETWPAALEQLSGRCSYNMGLGYYGIPQYVILARNAMRFKPKVIVIGIALGKDVLNAFHRVYREAPELYGTLLDPDVYARVKGNTYYDPWYSTTALPGGNDEQQARLKKIASQLRRENAYPGQRRLLRMSAGARLLVRAGITRAGKDASIGATQAAIQIASIYPDSYFSYTGPLPATVQAFGYRSPAIDMQHEANKEGMRVSKELLRQLKHDLAKTDTKLAILIIPNKETAYAKADPGLLAKVPASYGRMVASENLVIKDFGEFARREGYFFVDATDNLVKGLQRGEAMWPTHEDGHMLPAGYREVAKAVNSLIGSAQLLN